MNNIELYDRRFDWLVASLLAALPIWLFYGFDAAFLALPVFALVGALKPLVRALGSRLAAGIFAAGLLLFLSPLIRFVMPNGYCFEGVWSVLAGLSRLVVGHYCQPSLFGDLDQRIWMGPLRDAAMPVAGLGLMALSWLKKGQGGPEDDTSPGGGYQPHGGIAWSRLKPWAVLFLTVPLVAGLTYRNHLAERAAIEAAQAAERAKLAAEAAAAAAEAERLAKEEAAKRVDRAWLLGTWVYLDDLDAASRSDPKRYCATDSGVTFKADGTYDWFHESGRFTLERNIVKATNRTKTEWDVEDAKPVPLDDETFTVERSGKRLLIDGDPYGRC